MIKILLFILMLFISTAANATEGFIIDSLEEAQRLSDSTGKSVLLILGAESCFHCERLKTDILTDQIPDSDRYIICYLGLDENPDLKKKYSVSMIPDSRILKKNKTITTIKGYDRTKYSKWLKNAE
jgi:thioredoxin-related protein